MDNIITEEYIRKIVQEEINKAIIKEGIDISRKDNKRIVSVTNVHQNYVDTNNYYDPKLFDGTCKGYKTLSIFKRKRTNNSLDSNPLLNALKKRKGWEFNNATEDLKMLLKNFVVASKLLPSYDTIIMIPSHNELNKIVFKYLKRLVKHEHVLSDFFEKLTADEVYNCFLDEDYINNNFKEPNIIYNAIDDAFEQMNIDNDGIFSYKYFYKTKYRNAIIQSLKIKNYEHCELNYADYINGKDIMIFDDTITSGNTISDSAKAITDMFAPKTITYVTLFSGLDKNIK